MTYGHAQKRAAEHLKQKPTFINDLTNIYKVIITKWKGRIPVKVFCFVVFNDSLTELEHICQISSNSKAVYYNFNPISRLPDQKLMSRNRQHHEDRKKKSRAHNQICIYIHVD